MFSKYTTALIRAHCELQKVFSYIIHSILIDMYPTVLDYVPHEERLLNAAFSYLWDHNGRPMQVYSSEWNYF